VTRAGRELLGESIFPTPGRVLHLSAGLSFTWFVPSVLLEGFGKSLLAAVSSRVLRILCPQRRGVIRGIFGDLSHLKSFVAVSS
jgi:hypothetical protein